MEQDSSRKRPLDGDNECGVSKKSNQGAYLDDQVHLKILIPSVAAGAVIGKGGETISQIQKDNPVNVKMSKAQDFYPGTTERVCLVVGTIDAVKTVQKFVMDRIRDKPDQHPKHSEIDGKVNQERHKQMKILVPNSTAGMIIGKGGIHIKEIKDKSGAYIQISQKSKELNLPERCITIAGDYEKCQVAMDMIVQTIAEDPQSASCPNISYNEYRGPVASANPTGSPFAAGVRMMDSNNDGGGHMMPPPMPPPPPQGMMSGGGGQGGVMAPHSHHGGNMPMMQGGGGAMMTSHGGGMMPPNVFNNIGNGMHNLNLNASGAMAGGGMAGGAMSAADTMRATLRGSGYNDHAIEEIIGAVSVLANYGLFGFSLNLGGLGLQQQQGGMLNSLANIVNGPQAGPHSAGAHQGHAGPVPMGAGAPPPNMLNPAQRGAGDGNPQIFGPVGSTTTTKAGGDTGESPGSFYANAGGGGGDPRMSGNGEGWGGGGSGGGFNHGGGGNGQSNFAPPPPPPPGGMNQNSFGLGTAMNQQDMVGCEETLSKEMEVGEHIVGAILGPGGKGIIEIQNYTGANIQISKKGVFAPGTRNRVVTITGVPRTIQNAEYVIRQRISSEERSRSARQ